MKVKSLTFFRYFLIGYIFSFFGWLFETIQCIVLYKEIADRGFLTMPICPIYGFTLLFIYFIAGTPNSPRGILKNINNRKCVNILYFLIAFLIPTLMELLIGFFFDNYLNQLLWSYSDIPYSNKYISLFISLGWGFLITFIMVFVFPFIKRLVYKLSKKTCFILGIILCVMLLLDFSYNIAISI